MQVQVWSMGEENIGMQILLPSYYSTCDSQQPPLHSDSAWKSPEKENFMLSVKIVSMMQFKMRKGISRVLTNTLPIQ